MVCEKVKENEIRCVHVIGYKRGYGTSENINKDNYKMGIQDGI